MNLTLSIDDHVLERTRKVARTMGKTLNQLVREYLSELTADDDGERDNKELRELSKRGKGHSRGWRFNREELHERS
jgi:hypothetical protein